MRVEASCITTHTRVAQLIGCVHICMIISPIMLPNHTVVFIGVEFHLSRGGGACKFSRLVMMEVMYKLL